MPCFFVFCFLSTMLAFVYETILCCFIRFGRLCRFSFGLLVADISRSQVVNTFKVMLLLVVNFPFCVQCQLLFFVVEDIFDFLRCFDFLQLKFFFLVNFFRILSYRSDRSQLGVDCEGGNFIDAVIVLID